MDRLSALTLPLVFALGLALPACSREESQPVAQTRFAAVKAAQNDAVPAKWCDVSYTEAEAPTLELPPVVPARAGESAGKPSADRWVWVNLWATWCGPCRKEMPLLEQWKEQLARDGSPVELWYLSVDENEADLTRYLEANPGTAAGHSVRINSLSELEPWLKRHRLDATAAIPIQVIAAPGGKVRCVRVGQLHEGDYRTVKAILKS